MVHSIIKELSQRKSELANEKINTIYFGGGTPSLLSQREISQILEVIYKEYNIQDCVEITLESNPDDLSKDKLEILYQEGINRLSIGVQSFDDEMLYQLNRTHTAADCITALYLAKEIGFKNISIDLIFGLPGLDIHLWKKTLDKAIQFNVQHISCYNLTIEEKTALWHFVNKKKIELPPDLNQEDQFLLAHRYLKQFSYDHYEISNYALEGYSSKHNSNYWNRSKYLGIGPSAHSYNKELRRWNTSNNPKYIKALNADNCFWEFERLTEVENFNEYLMLALRQKKGIIKSSLKKYSLSNNEDFVKSLSALISKNLVSQNEDSYYLTPKQLYLSDHICSELFLTDENY